MKNDKSGFVAGMLNVIERVGNKLPHPGALFAYFALGIIFLSWLVSMFNVTTVHPGTGETIEAVNLLSKTGLHMIMTGMVTNFTSFAPLGTVLVALLGIGIAESSGLMSTGLRLLVISAPRQLLTFAIVFAGILSNTASEVGYVVLVPLGGMIFLAVGRNPIAGIAAAFAGVSGGYSANLLLGTIDPLLAGLSEEAARIVDATYTVNPAANYYFMFVSTFFIAYIGTWVTEKIVIPRLGEYKGDAIPEEIKEIDELEKRGLKFTLIAFIILVIIIAWSVVPVSSGIWGSIPGSGFMRDPFTGGLLRSPFMSGIVALIFLIAGILGIVYGVGAKTLKSSTDVINGMGKSMSTLGTYIVLVFFAAQFVAYFNWTNLGLIFAIKGANLIGSIGMGRIPLMIALVLVSAIINLVVGSASAKWAILAPVFIPMFMLLGYSPEFTQLAYRVGDSVTNVIAPMMSYFAMIVAFMERYDKKAGIGTIIATMIPYTIIFLTAWLIMLVLWILAGLPIGPGAPLFYELPEMMNSQDISEIVNSGTMYLKEVFC
ncbi:MAG: AbgT family transporter [Bacteroidetes bacterium]|nr:MAG: AbgT family transporter [Bacteroidota bacterium]